MVLCKYFQNGCCKFGDNCRFEHSSVGGGGGYRGGGGGYGGGGGGGAGAGEHYGHRGRSAGYNSSAGSGHQSPNRYSNYENRTDYRNDSRGGYRTDQRTDYRNDPRTDYRNDYRNENRNNNVNNDGRGGYRGDNRSENRFAALSDRHESSRQRDGGGGGGGGGRQYDARYSYRSNQQKKEADSEDLTPAEILEGIAEDMELWESGKMWLFSCYGYAREKKSFRGLDDLSADEVRLKAYEANAAGTMIAHMNWLSQLAEDYQAKRAALKKPDPNARSALLNMVEDIKKSSSQNTSSQAAHPGGAGLFTSETNSFGTTAQPTNAFGATVQPTNAFGAPVQPTNAFGVATPITNVFGAARPPTNVFGAATPTNGFSTSAFGGAATPGFSMITSTPIVPTTASAFSFGASATHNVFSPAGPSDGLLPASNAGLSGTTIAQDPSSSSRPSSFKLLGVYTPAAELSAEEKAEFESAKFTLDHVPLRPPPKNMI